MKKIFIVTLILGIFCTAQAGYIIRGINTFIRPHSLRNYTLTFDHDNKPIAAASMYTSVADGAGRNTIVIIPESPVAATYFPVSLGDFNYSIEVRDFHYLSNAQKYVLCGSRGTALNSIAFVAVIDTDGAGNLTTMQYCEYFGADIFYSIWAENSASPAISSDYFVCGKSGTQGVIASINGNFIPVASFATIDWEYHKIIVSGTGDMPRFVASGKNTGNTRIGFIVVDPSLSTIGSYTKVIYVSFQNGSKKI